jgi:hypothetical protein
MPKMYSLQVSTSASLLAGQPLFVAAVSPKSAHFTRKVLRPLRRSHRGGQGAAAGGPDGAAKGVDLTVETRRESSHINCCQAVNREAVFFRCH